MHPEDLIPDSRLRESALDAFGHREIAGRVADIAINGETPLNIALFGPWGSGKSSFFQMLDDALTTADPSIKVIRYDAWKFGGESLKRNFVSHAASELGLPADSPEGRPWSELVATRNVYAHYTPSAINKDRVWSDTILDVPRLLEAITAQRHR